MKKNSLKTILEDFFSWKHVLIWVIVLLLTGVGVAWGTGAYDTGYRLDHGYSNIKMTTLTGGVIAGNNSTFDYFVPTKTSPEFTAFVQNCPSTVNVIPVLCAAGTYYNHSLRCTDTCLTCPADYYCVGNGDKVACPSGETSPAGSTSFSACTPASATCVPSPACLSTDQCGTDNCGNACGPVCNSGYFCNNKHQCELNF